MEASAAAADRNEVPVSGSTGAAVPREMSAFALALTGVLARCDGGVWGIAFPTAEDELAFGDGPRELGRLPPLECREPEVDL
mmetsp:Transcript_2091/g.8162  ORF Transcript_2091/g.8162 Transcript_2091/m.8162 type:complete len:82 (+) Transcript_2091:692-937(+)